MIKMIRTKMADINCDDDDNDKYNTRDKKQ